MVCVKLTLSTLGNIHLCAKARLFLQHQSAGNDDLYKSYMFLAFGSADSSL